MTDNDRRALATFAAEMAASFAKLAAGLDDRTPGHPVDDGAAPQYGKVTQLVPFKERVLRQSLIVQAILDEGGTVTREEWYAIAARFGYTGRGLAGFFRKDGGGLLDMRGEKVKVTKNGRDRLAQNKDRVALAHSDA